VGSHWYTERMAEAEEVGAKLMYTVDAGTDSTPNAATPTTVRVSTLG
jgi:hypothetical protein